MLHAIFGVKTGGSRAAAVHVGTLHRVDAMHAKKLGAPGYIPEVIHSSQIDDILWRWSRRAARGAFGVRVTVSDMQHVGS